MSCKSTCARKREAPATAKVKMTKVVQSPRVVGPKRAAPRVGEPHERRPRPTNKMNSPQLPGRSERRRPLGTGSIQRKRSKRSVEILSPSPPDRRHYPSTLRKPLLPCHSGPCHPLHHMNSATISMTRRKGVPAHKAATLLIHARHPPGPPLHQYHLWDSRGPPEPCSALPEQIRSTHSPWN